MSVTDPVADMLTKIRNASTAKLEKVDIRPSRLKLEITKILKNEGYIKNFKKVNVEDNEVIRIFLKYDEKQNAIINGIKSVSTPGRRVYSGYKKMPRVFNGFGTVIVSSSAGVITGRKAVSQKLGGEVLCTIW